MNDDVRAELQRLVRDRGVADVVDDTGRLRAMLLDLRPADRAEVSVLVAAVEEGVAHQLVESPSPELRVPALTRQLVEHRGLADEAARWAVESWLVAVTDRSIGTSVADPDPEPDPEPDPDPGSGRGSDPDSGSGTAHEPGRPVWLAWAGGVLAVVAVVVFGNAIGGADAPGDGPSPTPTETLPGSPSPTSEAPRSPTPTPTTTPTPIETTSAPAVAHDVVFVPTVQVGDSDAERRRLRAQLVEQTDGLVGMSGQLGAIWFARPASWQGETRADPAHPYDYLYAAADLEAWKADHDASASYLLARRSVNTVGLGVVALRADTPRSLDAVEQVIQGTPLPANCTEPRRERWSPGDFDGWVLRGACADGTLTYGYAQLYDPAQPDIVVELEYVDPDGGLDPDPFRTVSIDVTYLRPGGTG